MSLRLFQEPFMKARYWPVRIFAATTCPGTLHLTLIHADSACSCDTIHNDVVSNVPTAHHIVYNKPERWIKHETHRLRRFTTHATALERKAASCVLFTLTVGQMSTTKHAMSHATGGNHLGYAGNAAWAWAVRRSMHENNEDIKVRH